MEKEIRKKLFKSINYRKATDYCNYTGKHGGAAHCDLKFNVLNEIHVVFCDGSNYDYHFILMNVFRKIQKGTKLFQFQ